MDTPIGTPTHVPHLRQVVNEGLKERSAPSGDRGSLRLLVNDEYGKPHLTRARKWADELVNELGQRTRNGTNGRGTNLYVSRYPGPAELEQVRKLLAEREIKLDIQPYASEDGTFLVWVEYIPTKGSAALEEVLGLVLHY